jgi:prepilin-type N-terminal cleavage/methylation domain-containing protein
MNRNLAVAGFTLLEVVIALTLSGLVLLTARQMVGQLADAADLVVTAASEADREANRERLLRALVGRIEPPTDTNLFVGHVQIARFVTWCDAPAGWQERCEVSLGFVDQRGKQVLAALLPSGELALLAEPVMRGKLLYLTTPNASGQWLSVWGRSITLPLAIGVVLDRDTLILRVGERG